MRGQRQKRLSLVRGSGIDLDVLRDGGRRQQGRERLRQGLKQRTALFRAAGIDLYLLHVQPALRQKRSQILHRLAQPLDHTEIDRVADVFMDARLHRRGDPCGVFRVAIICDVPLVQIAQERNGVLPWDLRAVDGVAIWHGADLRAVDRQGIVQKRERADKIRHTAVKPPGRGHDFNSKLRRAGERGEIAGRELFLRGKKRSVEVERDQMNIRFVHGCFVLLRQFVPSAGRPSSPM